MRAQAEVLSACTRSFCLLLFSSISLLFLHLFCTNKSFILFLTHSPTHNHAALLGQVVRWCFELLMKLAPFLEDKGGGGLYFQKPKLPLTWGQSFCPSEPCSNLLTPASVSADAIWKIKDACCYIECQCAVFSNVWHCKVLKRYVLLQFLHSNVCFLKKKILLANFLSFFLQP